MRKLMDSMLTGRRLAQIVGALGRPCSIAALACAQLLVDSACSQGQPGGGQGGLGNATGADGSAGAGGATAGNGGAAGTPSLSFLHRQAREIVRMDGRPVMLRGIAFGNDVWSGRAVAPRNHHAEPDFARLRAWGMNASRFYLNYQLFEDDAAPYQYKQAGWDWLDQNIAWARRHGVYLILNIHVPQGGFQSTGAGAALWDVSENRARLAALWRAIALRYRDEPAVAGFDLLNEPRPTTSRKQWADLAGALASAIREVDPRHLLFVERTNSVGEDWSHDADMNFFLLADENVAYEFHVYDPIEYTHQLTSWTSLGEGGKYPDETIVSGALTWYDWSFRPSPPPYLPAGDSGWARYESQPYAVTDPAVTAIGIALISELNAGTVYFDDIFINEYDPSGALVATVYEKDLESLEGWSFWKAGATGTAAIATEAHSGTHSLSISATDHDANLSTGFRLAPRSGYRYAAGGWMKGTAIGNASRPDPRGNWTQVSRALVRLDYFTGTVQARNQALLASNVDRYLAWAERHGVPLYLGEFGLFHVCFEGGRGGTTWVGDMLDIVNARGIPFTYHVFHEVGFGVFRSDPNAKLPDLADANTALIDTFRAKLLP